jgi:hypothetical protein
VREINIQLENDPKLPRRCESWHVQQESWSNGIKLVRKSLNFAAVIPDLLVSIHNEEFQMYSLQPIENNFWSQPCPMQL